MPDVTEDDAKMIAMNVMVELALQELPEAVERGDWQAVLEHATALRGVALERLSMTAKT